ncbi:MAG TPA: cob(I)yrinic acid a,c-diamide adenosyltransferase [Desulfomonilaceae bacterium]|nr:cob(I)yrinic acid a,c-diamide adenosyltransferase [Desulfomonilaceae bacterium]
MGKGLLLVFTGHSADSGFSAVGQVLRALGQGLSICVVQFHPGFRKYRELLSLKQSFDSLEIYGMNGDLGCAAANDTGDRPVELWRNTVYRMNSGEFDLFVLFELSHLIEQGMVGEKEVTRRLLERPDTLHVIVAGGNAIESLVQEADLVTEVNELNHDHQPTA